MDNKQLTGLYFFIVKIFSIVSLHFSGRLYITRRDEVKIFSRHDIKLRNISLEVVHIF